MEKHPGGSVGHLSRDISLSMLFVVDNPLRDLVEPVSLAFAQSMASMKLSRRCVVNVVLAD